MRLVSVIKGGVQINGREKDRNAVPSDCVAFNFLGSMHY